MWVLGETTVLRDAKGFVLTGRDLFVVSSSRDLIGRAPLEMKHECDA